PFKELGMVSITIKHKEETEQPRVAPKQPIDKHKNEKETKEAITRTDFPENKKIPPPTETPDFVPYDTPPEPVYITKPKYPESGKKAGIEGSAYLKLLLDSTGYVIDVKVVKSLNPAFDEAAVKAARTWRFTPAKQKGKSVRIWFGYSVRFILKRD
ncbi:MAG: energy transducer TonB, partial [bacterium]|nr:energy transducer TonB [bacterium]